MIDYLLKFPSKDVAIQFGASTGLAFQGQDGNWYPSTATHDHCLLEIGAHNGSDYWILFRDLVGISVPAEGEQFIYWCSEWTVTDEADGTDIPIPRPEFNPNVPSVFWA